MAIIKGSNLMLFGKKSDKMVSVAFATNHTLNVTVDTQDTSTKDNGLGIWKEFEAGLIGWTTQSDSLVGAGEGLDYDELFDKMVNREPIDVAFGVPGNAPQSTNDSSKVPAGGWTPSTNYYSGKAIITSLDVNAQNGETANGSISLTGTGPLKKIGKGISTVALNPSASTAIPVPGVSAESASEKVETAALKK